MWFFSSFKIIARVYTYDVCRSNSMILLSRESCKNIQVSSRKIAPKSLKSHPVYRNVSKKMNVGQVVLNGRSVLLTLLARFYF